MADGVTGGFALVRAASGGPPPLGLDAVFTRWTADIPTIVFVLLVAALYARGVRRVRLRGGTWPRSRAVALGTGLALVAVTGLSFVGVYADTLFWVRATQVITLLMVVPLCLAMSSPVALATDSLSERGVERLRQVMASRWARVLTYPASASVLLIGTPWLLYFTGWYPAVLENAVVDHVTRLVLLTVGFVYFYSRLQLDPVPRKYPHMVSVVITFVEVIFDAALGLVLWLSPHLVADAYYTALGRHWGPSPRTDQIVGAGVLWLVGDLAGLPFLGALMNRMSKDDAAEAEEIDRKLDEQDLARATAEAVGDTEAARTRLWWEDDPVLAERFRRGRRG